MPSYSDIANILTKSQEIAVFMHVNPDGDCISSALALTLFLKKLGKTVYCISPNFDKSSINEKFCFLPGFDTIGFSVPDHKIDLSFGVDLGDAGRLGDKKVYSLFLKANDTVVVDHHKEHIDFARTTLREEKAASTTQILYKIMKSYKNTAIDADIATCLYTGLVTDSGAFTYSNTSPETLVIASELLSYGIDAPEIVRKVMKDTPKRVFDLKNRVLSRAEFFDDNKIAVIAFRKDDFEKTGCTEVDTEGIINNILNVTDVELAISISEYKGNTYKVSWRSKHDIDASACAKAFGGGGHFNAAGCRVNGVFEDAYQKVLTVAREIASYA